MSRWTTVFAGLAIVMLAMGCGSPEGDSGERVGHAPGTATSTATRTPFDPTTTPRPEPTATPEPTPEQYVTMSIEDGVIRWDPKPPGQRYHLMTVRDVRLLRERWVEYCQSIVIEERPLVIDAYVDAPTTEYDLRLTALPAGEQWYVLFWDGMLQLDVLDATGAVMYSGGYSSVRC